MAAAKIDLKARLGRKSAAPVAAPAQAVAPVARQSGMPSAPLGSAPPPAAQPFQPSAPPPAAAAPVARPMAASPMARPVASRPVGGGIPGPGGVSIPPPPGFGARPVAAQPTPQAPAAPQLSIKMEMGEEVVQAQRANRKKTAVIVAGAAMVALVIGFGVGQLAKGNEGAQAAVAGAELLLKEVDASNIALGELESTLTAAGDKLKAGDYPSDEIEKLGALDIPFDGSNLLNKGIGRYNQTAVTMLVGYVNAVENVEDRKEKIRRLFGAAKEAYLAEQAEKKNPQVKWGVTLKGGPGGPWGAMALIKPFEVVDKDKKAKWPNEIESGGKKVARMTKGDITKTDGEVIPIDPLSQNSVCPETVTFKLLGALSDLRDDLKGDNTPGRERAGVAEVGEKLMDQLRRIGGPG